jgi:ferredoxin--NADP+ reductase
MSVVYSIRNARFIGPDVKRFEVVAPRVARYWQPGQFVIVRATDDGERIPLTVVEADPGSGTIVLIVQGVGKTTRTLNALSTGDVIPDVAGPLGSPSDIEAFGTVVVIGGGVGTAIAYPTAKALSLAGNRIVAIVGARSADLLILVDELGVVADSVVVTTDDGTAGRAGFVTDALADVVASEPVDRVIAIGPLPMMEAVSALTRPLAIPTIVSLNPIMVDGTGMCGGCRVSVGGETKFACVDGPEFDAHGVDFAMLRMRNRTYCDFERRRLEEMGAT